MWFTSIFLASLATVQAAPPPVSTQAPEIRYVPRTRLNLVRAGVETHVFPIDAVDATLLSLGVGLSAGLQRAPAASDGFLGDDIAFLAFTTIPTLIPLETVEGSRMRNVGRSVVHLELTSLGRLAGLTGGVLREDVGGAPAGTVNAWGRVAASSASITGWAAIALKSRRRRGLAFDEATLGGLALASAIGMAGSCALAVGVTKTDAQAPWPRDTFGDSFVSCLAPAALGSATAILVPTVHLHFRGGQ